MPVQYIRYERRDAVDRNELGSTMLDLCRHLKAIDGVQSARYYWPAPDQVVLLVDGTAEGLNAQGSVGVMTAYYKLGDLARTTANERWSSAGEGERSYREAAR